MPSNIKPRIRLLVPQAKLSVIQYIAIRHRHRRNFSVLTAKLIVLPRLMVVKVFKMDKNLVFSTFDPRPRLLTLDLDL